MFYLILLAFSAKYVWTYGYDSGGATPNSCGRPYRAGRMHKPPCNLAHEGGYCKDAGENYPWHAVKRFVKENRGLMRRMYGEQPEGTLLREELARISPENVRDRFPRQHQPSIDIDNELYRDEDEDYEDLFQGAENYIKQEYELKFEGRYMRDEDVLRTKFIYAEEPPASVKESEVKSSTPSSKYTTTPPSKTTTIEGTTMFTGTSITSTSSNTSPIETDLENSTVASSREADGGGISSEVTTSDFDEIGSTTTEAEKTTKLAFSTQTTTDKIESSSPVQNNAVLFQDMEEGASEKVKVNYKLAGVNACPVKEEVVAPFWANNTRGEVLALLNMYPFEQYVHWEKCSFENKQMYCREGCRCEQQYRLHRLLAYDPQNECKGIFSDWFRFPSCCVCKCYGLPSEFRVTSRSPRNGGVRWFDTGTHEED